MTRPISFDNISARLQGFESTRLHENDWRNVVEYVHRLESLMRTLATHDDTDFWLLHRDSENLDYGYVCMYCDAHRFVGKPYIHRDDCPLTVAREALDSER